MQDSTIYEPLLVEILSNSPVIGATLKQRLMRLARERSLPPFSLEALGFRTFKQYLRSAVGDLVTVMLPVGPGDILVFLNPAYRDQIANSQLPTAESVQGLTFRSAVWQAFCNPDAERKRYLHRSTGAVRHFLVSEATPADIQDRPGDFIEISNISAEQQLGWMRDYGAKLAAQGFRSVGIDTLQQGPYTSGLNKAFTQELGAYADEWRKERTALVTAAIHNWATKNKVSLHILYASKDAPIPQFATPVAAASVSTVTGTREKVYKLLEVLSDEDLARLVLPTVLNAILTTTQT